MSKKPRRQPEIQITRKVLEVALSPNASSGFGEFDIHNFQHEKTYKVYGAMWVRYEDSSGVACWLVEDDNGVVTPKAMSHFRIVKAEDDTVKTQNK